MRAALDLMSTWLSESSNCLNSPDIEMFGGVQQELALGQDDSGLLISGYPCRQPPMEESRPAFVGRSAGRLCVGA
jgi:hypothetical protein